MTIQCRRSLFGLFRYSAERYSYTEGGIFGILSLYVNVINFGGYPKKPLVAVVTLRAGYLDARYVRPFRYPLDCGFYIGLRLCHLRSQCLLGFLVRPNRFSDTAHVCRHRSMYVGLQMSTRSFGRSESSRGVFSAVITLLILARRSCSGLMQSLNKLLQVTGSGGGEVSRV